MPQLFLMYQPPASQPTSWIAWLTSMPGLFLNSARNSPAFAAQVVSSRTVTPTEMGPYLQSAALSCASVGTVSDSPTYAQLAIR